MIVRLLTPVALAALTLLSVGPAPAAVLARPVPKPTPLKTIKHVYSNSRMCMGLRRSIGPAVGKVLQNDKTIATSRPMLQDFVASASLGSEGGKDMAVARLERLVGPLVKGTQNIEALLNDPIYPRKAQNDNDKQLLQMRTQLAQVLAKQKNALDLISGFIDTEQLGQLQAAGHQYDAAVNSNSSPNAAANRPVARATTAPAEILNAGVNTAANDPAGTMKNDPRYANTNNAIGYNPLNMFDQQMLAYQAEIAQGEAAATFSILKAVPQCGGKIPGPSSPPLPSPLPAPSPSIKP
ncbi:MAG: hypothetical protein ABR508_07920 [Candidatus Baltobacteraceae bacterium]